MSMIAYCGLTCTECPAYTATQSGDTALAQRTAEGWAQMFDAPVTVDDVWCDGCLVEGRKCTHCGECEIRACGVERGVDNCPSCADYPCDKLAGLHGMVPAARETLDRLLAS